MEIKFEWDKKKAASNLKKHGISFEVARTVFNDSLASIFDDEYHSADERREIIIGYSTTHQLLLVCFTEPTENVIRIFSARPATKNERKDYEENA